MIDFVELASSVENYILIVFVIVVNHVGFIFILFIFKRQIPACPHGQGTSHD
ncbi:MAG: hypothetical protein GT598_02080 [Bacteroidales bacterium]|nr:hypothetical protein [Bacteroidales bacterium]HQG76078.1 hypothetical protein [Bacteroidales bacterium]